MAKQQHSDADVNKIDGPTLPNASPIPSPTDLYFRLSNRSYVCTSIKILSTPIARTKNGITFRNYQVNKIISVNH